MMLLSERRVQIVPVDRSESENSLSYHAFIVFTVKKYGCPINHLFSEWSLVQQSVHSKDCWDQRVFNVKNSY